MRTQRCLIFAFMLAASSASTAHAQPRDDAGRRYGQAVAAFEASDYATALTGFQETYVLTRRPEVLINVAVCFQRLGRPGEALTTYRNYLALAADSPNRAAIEGVVAQLERDIAASSRPATPTATPVAPPPPPPPHVAPVVEAPAPLWPWIAVGSGAALTLAGGLLLALPSDPGADPSVTDERAYLAARDQRSTMLTVGAVIGGVGLVATAVGLVAVITRSAPRAHRTGFDLRWRPLAEGGAVTLSGAF